MTETISLEIESEDLKEFQQKTGMSIVDCINLLINSVKYSGKLELDTFWCEKNIAELTNRIKSGKMQRHELIEVD